jgi:integrase
MKATYRLYQRDNGIFYAHNNETNKQESLKTKDRATAERLFHAKNEAYEQPAVNLQIARAYLTASDPEISKRTWQHVMEAMSQGKTGSTLERWKGAIRDKAFDRIRHIVLLETNATHFLRTLEAGTVATNVFLRRIQNFALGMSWLPWPVLPKKQWPAVKYGEKRAVTAEEHRRIVERERNPEWNAFYQMCWHLGGSQSDIANLLASDIDWQNRLIAYRRGKSGSPVIFHFGEQLKALLKTMAIEGQLFPRLCQLHEKHRAKLFNRRCKLLGIKGVTLHSYRYAWAQRAKTAGYPERFAQQALGHQSKAIHRAYAKHAQVKLPSLEEFEMRSGA